MAPRHTLAEEALRDPLPGLRSQLVNEFGSKVPPEQIERMAEQALHQFDSARIREFVPVFAWRRARQLVRDAS
jgi:hypothetical protein